MRVEVVAYDPAWPARFEAARARLLDALRDVPVLAIEHVGSTSVPGLAAKPIIDIDVVVERPVVVMAAAALERAAYVGMGDLGVTDRFAFRAPDKDPRRNVYVVVAGSLSLRNHLGVRRALREDDGLRDRYAAVKLELAQRDYRDLGGYVADKSPIVAQILARSGLTADELATIEEQNRDR